MAEDVARQELGAHWWQEYKTLENISANDITDIVIKSIVDLKEAKLKSIRTVWFQLDHILKKTELWRQQKDQGLGRGTDRQSSEGF